MPRQPFELALPRAFAERDRLGGIRRNGWEGPNLT
jgi:hypothetical protein